MENKILKHSEMIPTKADWPDRHPTDFKARRRAIKDHIKLLKRRYPEPVRRKAVELLEARLKAIS